MNISYSVAGKVILLGEYAVLTGRPALVAAIPPRFQLNVSTSGDKDKDKNKNKNKDEEIAAEHPKSPLGRLKAWAKKEKWPGLSFSFLDPYQGTGGFGASTAQFALAYYAYFDAMKSGISSDSLNWRSALALYRQLMSDEHLVPSGADLVAQWEGGIVHFNPRASSCTDLSSLLDGSSVLVFSATRLQGRKVPTHEHLELLSKQGFPNPESKLLDSLAQITEQGVSAIREGSAEGLGQSLDAYAECLHEAELEVAGAYEDRKALRLLPGVLGVKGAGALQSDALIVVVENASLHRDKVIEKALERGLILVSNGIVHQKGIKSWSK